MLVGGGFACPIARPSRLCGSAGEVMVVEQTAQWPLEPGGPPGEPQAVASLLRVRAGRVASVIRYPDLDTALAAAGLDMSDQEAFQNRSVQ